MSDFNKLRNAYIAAESEEEREDLYGQLQTAFYQERLEAFNEQVREDFEEAMQELLAEAPKIIEDEDQEATSI